MVWTRIRTLIVSDKRWILQVKHEIIFENTGGWFMDRENASLDLRPIKNGWAVLGTGWAVHGETREEAVRRYYEAIERHKEIDARRIETREEVDALANRS